MIEVLHGDCLQILPSLGRYGCAFLDPPDNIGLDYEGYHDRLDVEGYGKFLENALSSLRRHTDCIWVSFNARHIITVSDIVRRRFSEWKLKPCVQTFTFGQHSNYDFGNCHRPLWRLTKGDVPFFSYDIRVTSQRQQMGDKRADPRGRVPGDNFEFPRVTGNSKQRRKWHVTQLHEGLVERCVRSCVPAGGSVLDPMAGTGTTARVCQRIGRNCTIIEVSPTYCKMIQEELTNGDWTSEEG